MTLHGKCRNRWRLAILVGFMLSAQAVSVGTAKERPSPAYEPVRGGCEVGVVDEIVLHDDARDKDLSVKVYYPTAGGPFPVIIFSHGGGGSKDGYADLGAFWASHGYVSIHPTHADSVALRRQNGERVRGLRDVVRQALTDAEGWKNRPKDISFIIDSLALLAEEAKPLAGKMDLKRIGVGGHSFGAYTSQVIGGATVIMPGTDKPVSRADKRVRAVVLLSAQGVGQMGLHEHSWDHFSRPMLSMTGSRDLGAKRQDPQWREDSFKRSPPGDKYFVFIEGADHFSFSGRAAQEGALGRMLSAGARLKYGETEEAFLARQKRIFGYVRSATLAFWDAFLKDDAAAKTWLRSKSLEDKSNGQARALHR